jgi:hypothetical protein
MGRDRDERSQKFVDEGAQSWVQVDFLPGVELSPLAQPVPEGSIHRARLAKGTVIPIHTHPADEYVLVLSGTVETAGRRCESGCFWTTPAGTRQGPHVALTDAELLTVRWAPWASSASPPDEKPRVFAGLSGADAKHRRTAGEARWELCPGRCGLEERPADHLGADDVMAR